MGMQNFMTQVFYWMLFNYVIWLPLGAALGSAVSSFLSVVLTCFVLACATVVLLLLAGLILKADSMERFGT